MKKLLLFIVSSLLISLNVSAQLTVTITHSDVSCNGRSDGSATATATGGLPPYSYSWSNGATTRTINGLAAGTYSCTVTALGGATASASVTIEQPSAITFTTSVTDNQCFGASTGSATVAVSGGTPPYTYNWLPSGGTAATANNLKAGTYRCVIVDANGCDALATVTVADGAPISFTTTQTNVSCRGTSTGSATVTASGTGAPFTYSWSPSGGTGATASNLAAGTYTCTITNNLGCDTTVTFNITEPAAALSATITHADIRCFGETGSATVKASGGTAPYTYSWSPSGGTGATASNLAAGTYSCLITDANGCTTTVSATITSPAAALSYTSSQVDVKCFGAATGSATVNVAGGTAPYTYSWSSGGGTAATASNLVAGTYTCDITDANNCKITATIAITQPPQLELATTQTDILCNGGNTGSATVNASGGVAPYTYSWSPSGGTGATASNLIAGTYTCTVTDANGCTETAAVTITEPTVLSATTSQVNILCYGSATGSATVTASGGVAPYSYSWSPNGGTAATANNLTAGTYTCTITDANGCTTTATVTVTEQPQITYTTSQTNILCNGGNAGSASVTVSGGTPGYTYSWSPAGGTAATANGLAAGTYTCLITDANGCDTTATIVITEPPALSATATRTNISCYQANDGTVTAIVSGGVTPYTYSWSPGGETTATVNNLGPGTYTCTATDANGCTITGTVSLTEPTPLTATSTSTGISCNGGNNGTVTAIGAGGTEPYTYSWSNGATTATTGSLTAGTYTCTVTDANGCTTTTSTTVNEPAALSGSISTVDVTCNGANNGSATVHVSGGTAPYTYAWSNGGTSQTINNLAPGNYTVVITDANGCTFNVTTPGTVTEPPVLAASATHTDVGCNGEKTGTATATATGGTAPYSYQWSPSGGTGAIATGLGAGTYTCTITDAEGCTTTVDVTINQSSSLNASFSAGNISCKGAADGTATATVTGGATPYTYSWSPGGETTPSLSNLGPGTYTCTVTDANGCSIRQTVEVMEPALLIARDTVVSNISCNGSNDGIAKVTPSGGTAPYTYSWAPGGGTAQTMSGLAPGTYTTTVTDANGCTATSSVTILEPSALNGSISHTNTTSLNGNDGTATATGTGGTAPYTYSWSPGGATSKTITGLSAGTYTCTITDANGCTTTESVTITDPTGTGLGVNVSHTDVSCNGGSNGTATVTAYGGTSPYTYSWSPGGATTPTINGLTPGTYTCVITDAASDQQTITVDITEPAALTSSATGTDVLCNGASTGSAVAVATGGTPPYAYLWSNGVANDTITNLLAGDYTVTITDGHDCESTATVTINQPAAIQATTTQTNVTCFGYNDGIATVNATGGAGGYSYKWLPSGGGGQTATGLAPGTYTCTITDINDCSLTVSVDITEPDALAATANRSNVSCNGAGDGATRAIITGGTAPYTYSWTPGGQTTDTISNLIPGTYTAYVTDANNCKIIGTVEITQPATLTSSISHVNTTCNGDTDGSATLNASGGTLPYTYSWSNGETTQAISNLAPGNYTCTVTDANGCTSTSNVTIDEPAVVSANITKSDAVCNGSTDGSITLSGTGGTAPYTYLWQDGSTTATIQNLAAGNYSCTITDAHGCTGTVNVVITEPAEITATVVQTNPKCNGNATGTASLTATGGSGVYTYSWAPSGGTGAIATGLTAGTYTCTITDSKSCVGVVTVTITEPDPLTVAVDQTDVSCNGANDGKMALTPSGGTAPYTYTWSTGETTSSVSNLAPGTHQFVVTDANNCILNQSFNITEPPALTATSSHTNVSCNRGSDGTATAVPAGGRAPYTYLWAPGGATTATATGLIAGTYTCTITDSSGCTTTTSTTITQPTALALVVTPTNVSCNGADNGSASITTSGGTAPYTYLWSNSATTSTVNNLAPGIYSCTITDANGCDTSIVLRITEPDIISFTTSQTNVLCNGAATGSATVTVDGGTAPYTYSWSPSGGTGSTANNLIAGTYTCTITDAHGCDTTATVTITQPTAITFTSTQTNVDCNGNSSGSAAVVVSGGVGPYTYFWSPAGGTGASASNLSAGTYSCVITDANGCSNTATFSITEPDVLGVATSQVNVNCNGGSTGSATANVSGGTAPYTYNWSNGGTAATISNLAAGSYSCTITDAQGCVTTASVVITEKTALVADITPDNVLCNGGSTGSIFVDVSGGTAPYTYLWSNGATSSTAANLAAGTYTCTITDANGCDTSVTATITEPASIAVTTTQVDVNCNGGSTGSATITASGGTAPYHYFWSNGETTTTASNLLAGTYTCTVTDANGCDTTATVTITEKDAITAAVTKDDVLCNGGNTGSITLAVSGGTSPYTYLWSNGATTATVNNLTAGTYTATITDANGCDTTVSAIIIEPDALSPATSQVNVNCNGASTGSATVTMTGGTSPYSYLWSNGATTATINNLAAGTYTCTITDAHGCDTTTTVTISENAAITATVTQDNVLCHDGNNGSISITATGGEAPYSYLWSNGATTATISGLTVGTYTCTITDTLGCTGTVSATITEPDSLTFTTSQTDVNCNGASTGSATVAVDGGRRPYSYLWSNGDTRATISNIPAGTYTCTITDANGCDTTATVTITEKDAITVVSTQDNVLCNGTNSGSITVAVSGGTAPYSYLWNNGATTATVNNLTAGTYTATITDVNGCDTTISATITEPDVLSFTATQVDVNCNGGNTGTATVAADGGRRPYHYLWSNGATTASITNLVAGTYTCTITDANGCDTTATITITEKDAITAIVNQDNVLCHDGNNGTISLLTTGGTRPYSYLWSNGATTASISGLAVGTYTCTITDANGCTGTASATITEPDSLIFTTSQTDVNCNGASTGSATVAVDGGRRPYSYLWSNGGTRATISNIPAGTYTCTITDANGCDTTATVTITEKDAITAVVTQDNVLCNGTNSGSITVAVSGGTAPYSYLWNNGATTATVNNLTAGTYTATITDVNGCDTTISATITEPDVLSFTATQVDVNCNGGNTGTATVAADGGRRPYHYLWSNGATTASINNLVAGTYTCTITDANGCDTTATITITEKDAITAVVTQDNVLCRDGNNGTISLSTTGGTSPYSYLWSNGATTASISGLAVGTYTCTITDANGCTGTASATITEPDSLTFTTSQADVNCNGASTGSATVAVDGGSRPYSYRWSNGGTTATISNIPAGTYTCTITDANGCDTTATVTITEKDAITAVVTQDNVLCNGNNSGSIAVAVSGGTAPYTYLWNNGATTATINNLTAGTYTATITDVNGCDTTISATITEPDALSFTATQVDVSCNGGNTGSATINVTGGTGPYSYSWSNGATTPGITNLAAGTYTCTITDANGCDTSATITILQQSTISAVITQNDVSCNGGNTGSISVAVSGGTAPYTYLWSNGAATASISNLTAGAYTVTVTDANGCDTTGTVNIAEPDAISIITSHTDIDCNGGNTGSVSVIATGGVPPYTYLWNNGATTAAVTNLAAGKYTCTITDANGCNAEANAIVLTGGFEALKLVSDVNNNGMAEENELLTYTIRVKNTGSVVINNISITDAIPEHTEFVSSAQGTLANNVVSFTDVNLPANQQKDYVFIVRAAANLQGVNTISNTAEVRINTGGTSDCSSNPVIVIPVSRTAPAEDVDLSILKQTENKPVTVPDKFDYTFVVSNSGSTAHPVTITDILPAGLTYISSVADKGVADYNTSNRTITWLIDSLQNNSSALLTLRVQADAMGTIVNTAKVSSPQVDTNPENNESSVKKDVVPFHIPNVITPNGSGQNDKFVIKGLDLYSENEILIFNRWNANVYQKKNYQNDWDGDGLNEGTYFYILKLKDDNNVWHTYKGNVLLIRK